MSYIEIENVKMTMNITGYNQITTTFHNGDELLIPASIYEAIKGMVHHIMYGFIPVYTGVIDHIYKSTDSSECLLSISIGDKTICKDLSYFGYVIDTPASLNDEAKETVVRVDDNISYAYDSTLVGTCESNKNALSDSIIKYIAKRISLNSEKKDRKVFDDVLKLFKNITLNIGIDEVGVTFMNVFDKSENVFNCTQLHKIEPIIAEFHSYFEKELSDIL